jgi:hypothetical protein
MHRFIDGEDRMQRALLPHSLEDYVDEENPVRVIEVFIHELDLAALGFSGMTPAATGRPAYHPSTLLKIYLYAFSRALKFGGDAFEGNAQDVSDRRHNMVTAEPAISADGIARLLAPILPYAGDRLARLLSIARREQYPAPRQCWPIGDERRSDASIAASASRLLSDRQKHRSDQQRPS